VAQSNEFTVIEISMDGVWAGSGKLVDGRIEDCGAQFCDDSDESLEVYDAIEAAIELGKTKVKAAFRGDRKQHEITWTITEPS
jgi:hypothetical protein